MGSMRVGIHCSPTRISVALVSRGSVRAQLSRRVVGGNVLDAAERALTAIARQMRSNAQTPPVESITAEVSELLSTADVTPIHRIRITPRRGDRVVGPPGPAPDSVLHLQGGHNAQGEEIVPLDTSAIERLVARTEWPIDPPPRFVFTAVGALLNSEHERRAGAALLALLPHASIEYGHQFHHTSLAVREHTALVNISLRDRAESIVTALSVLANQHFPEARLLVATNSGGCIPLTRLALNPIHSIDSGHATEAVVATLRSAIANGPLHFTVGADAYSCEVLHALPSVVPALQRDGLEKLASPSANLRVRRTASDRGGEVPAIDLLDGTASTPAALRAIGAALLPRVEWTMAYIEVGNESEMARSRLAAEARVHARLVASGVPPESIRTVESIVTATSYGNPRVIALRIRAIADPDHPLTHTR